MVDLEQLQSLALLFDNIETLTYRLEKAYNDNDAENFNSAKKEILEVQAKISQAIK